MAMDMNESINLLANFLSEFQQSASQLFVYFPKIFGAILVLLLGWLLARLLRTLVVRAVARFDELWHSVLDRPGLSVSTSQHSPARVFGELLFWFVLFLFISLAAEVLGIEAFDLWMKDIIGYLLLAALGLFIVWIGYIVSVLARDLVLSATVSAGTPHGEVLATAAQVIIVIIAVILGIDQIGIDILFLVVFIGIVFVTVSGGLALAFGFGSRTHVQNIIAANQLRQRYQNGEKIRFGEMEGQILEISIARVLLQTQEGRVDIPAKLFDESVIIVLDQSS